MLEHNGGTAIGLSKSPGEGIFGRMEGIGLVLSRRVEYNRGAGPGPVIRVVPIALGESAELRFVVVYELLENAFVGWAVGSLGQAAIVGRRRW